MTPELPIAMLACARIGATHSVVFGGFSANALIDRINDAQCKAVITQDGAYRRGAEIPLKATVDEALSGCPSVKAVIVYKRTGSEVQMTWGRDHWWHDLMADASDHCEAEPLDAEHPLYILYTSGSTGKPKGVVHTTGGYSVAHLHNDEVGVRSERRRRLLVHGGHRVGDGAQLHCLRASAKRRDHA